jgi:adenosylcobinamide-GDP ribazoletransferase
MDGSGEKEAAVLRRFATALTFLTRLPLPASALKLSQAMDMFPVAGALVGLVCGGVYWFAAALGATQLLAAGVAVIAGLLITGALHEDGLADTADSLGGGSKDERLAIMRDSRIGTYGVLALILAILTKVAAIAGIPAATAIFVLAGTGAFSRMTIVWLMWSIPPARPDGLSSAAGRPDWPVTFRAILIGAGAAIVLLAFSAGPLAAIVAPASGAVVAEIVRYRAMRRLGGQTGDVCGALQVSCEIAMLFAIALTLR